MGRWGAFSLWDTAQAREAEVRTMGRVEAPTGVAPAVLRFEVEAIQEGRHAGADLLTVGLARPDFAPKIKRRCEVWARPVGSEP
jgi:hypothetical protein